MILLQLALVIKREENFKGIWDLREKRHKRKGQGTHTRVKDSETTPSRDEAIVEGCKVANM